MALDTPLHDNGLPVDAGFGGTLGTMTRPIASDRGVVTPSLPGTTRVITCFEGHGWAHQDPQVCDISSFSLDTPLWD